MKLPIGISDFKDIVNGDYVFVDKSLLIKDIIDEGSLVLLFTRPRRFGKTLNMSMLQYYFSRNHENTAALFKKLKIWQQGAEYQRHQGQYPVIFLSLKGVKFSTFADAYQAMATIIQTLYRQHDYILTSNKLNQYDQDLYQRILNLQASPIELGNSLKNLTKYLHEIFGTKIVLLIDEYDSPIHASFAAGYYQEMITFMQHFLSEALKDNPSIYKGILTGILRVAKESIFSGLNNLDVYSLLRQDYAQYFGFTQEEVDQLLHESSLTHLKNKIRDWYNGYQIQNVKLYNPWSILNCIKRQGETGTYWVNTSDNELIAELLQHGSSYIYTEFEKLIQGKPSKQLIDENVIFADIDKLKTTIWSFLLNAGYLTASKVERDELGTRGELLIPNKEVAALFRVLIHRWFDPSHTPAYSQTLTALINGDIETFKSGLGRFLLQTFSYFDTTSKTPEQTYHAFVLGLIAGLSDHYLIRSNREAGDGRYDVVMIPKDKKRIGIIFEFKALAKNADQQTLQKAAQAALQQIQDRQYLTEFEQAGIQSVIPLGLAFAGKSCEIATTDGEIL